FRQGLWPSEKTSEAAQFRRGAGAAEPASRAASASARRQDRRGGEGAGRVSRARAAIGETSRKETQMQLPPLATTTIGSFPRPHWLEKTNVTRASFVVAPEDMQEACDDATVLVLRHQEKLGLDVVTDGEQRREGFIFHIAGQWNGVDTRNLAKKERY